MVVVLQPRVDGRILRRVGIAFERGAERRQPFQRPVVVRHVLPGQPTEVAEVLDQVCVQHLADGVAVGHLPEAFDVFAEALGRVRPTQLLPDRDALAALGAFQLRVVVERHPVQVAGRQQAQTARVERIVDHA